jgi:hypothetical protein
MPAHVAHQVDMDLPLREAPLTVTALERVVVTASGDGLQGKSGQRLQHGEIRARDRRARLIWSALLEGASRWPSGPS